MAKIVCPVCRGKGWNKITWIKEDPRSACTCGHCHGTGLVSLPVNQGPNK